MKIADRLKQTFFGKPAAVRFTGDFNSWEEAKAKSSGYDAPQILEKTRAALLKVKEGKAAFERDSMAFDKMESDFSLLDGLRRVAAIEHGQLNVLDFGGSLGGTYFHCRNFLSAIDSIRWSVVEQPAHVACGRRDFANEELHFYETIAECLREQTPNVLLLSGVLQYLPKPYVFLENVLGEKIPHVIIERTAFNPAGRDRLTVQHVPPWLYDASYPAWFLNEAALRTAFAQSYDLVGEHQSDEAVRVEEGTAVFKGFQFQRKNG